MAVVRHSDSIWGSAVTLYSVREKLMRYKISRIVFENDSLSFAYCVEVRDEFFLPPSSANADMNHSAINKTSLERDRRLFLSMVRMLTASLMADASKPMQMKIRWLIAVSKPSKLVI